jgi:hypothetical protein
VQIVVLAFLPALLVAQMVSYLVSEMRRRPLGEVAQAATIAVGKNAIEEAGNANSESNAKRRGAGLLRMVSRLPNLLPANTDRERALLRFSACIGVQKASGGGWHLRASG